MAGNIKTNSVTLGDSATDSQNFQLRTNVDGTATLARGAAGNLGDILTVDAAGAMATPLMPFVGTAPVIESGSNANGNYVKWADGTMICNHIKAAGGNVNTAEGSIFTTPSTSWVFPVPFVSAPVVVVNEVSGVGGCWGGLGTSSASTTGTSFMLKRSIGWAAIPNAGLVAIGRWK